MMAEGQGSGDNSRPRFIPPAWMTGVLWAFIVLAVSLAALVFFLPMNQFWFIGNTFEVVAAGYCMLCCLLLYRFHEDRVIFSLAAFAFFAYALSNVFWYLYSLTFGRGSVYISVAEIGFFSFTLFFISAITIEFPRQKVSAPVSALLIVTLFVIPVIITAAVCLDQPLRLVLTVVRFLLIEQLVDVTIRHGVCRYPLLCAGIVVNCIGDIMYGIRETIILRGMGGYLPGPIPGTMISAYDLLSIVGPVMVCSFALIVLGLFSSLSKNGPATRDV